MSRKHGGCTRGQSLVEFVLVAPILILVLVIAGYVGIGMYQAHMASDAIRQPALKKLEMAAEPGGISNETLLGYVTGGPLKGNINSGGAVDSVNVTNTGASDLAAIIVGNKQFTVNFPGLPAFNFTAAQAIQKNLLLSAEFGAKKRSLDGWVPGGTPRQPPWMAFPSLPPGFDLLGQCQKIPIDIGVIKAVDTDKTKEKIYIAVPDVPDFPSSPVKLDNIITLATKFAGECDGYQASVCDKEYADFLPEKLPDVVIQAGTKPDPFTKEFKFKNPPGAPGLMSSYRITCDAEDATSAADCKLVSDVSSSGNWKPDFSLLPEITADHGWYFDPTDKYEKPPDDFKESCKSRKKAECQVKKALDKANEIVAQYGIECQGI